MSMLVPVGIALVIIGAAIALYYSSIALRCLCPYNVNCDCNSVFLPHKVAGVSLLIAGAALLVISYTKRHSAATPKGQTTNDR